MRLLSKCPSIEVIKQRTKRNRHFVSFVGIFPILVSKSGDNKEKCRGHCTKGDSKDSESRERAEQRNELKGQIGSFYFADYARKQGKVPKIGSSRGRMREGQCEGSALLVAAVKGKV